MKWWEARLVVPLEAGEAVSALVQEFPEIQGVQMEGAIESTPMHPEYGEWLAEELLAAEDVMVTVYFPEYVEVSAIPNRLLALLDTVAASGLSIGQAKESIQVTRIDESDWENAWKEHFHPIPVGNSLLIVPAWELDSERATHRLPIILEPGMAFGTGTHETTQLCLEALEGAMPLTEKTVLDVGCGTAVLAIAAAKLGAKQVTAIDIDPVAVQVALENIERNHCGEAVQVLQGDLLNGFAEDQSFDIVLANILRDIVVLLTPQVSQRMKKGSMFISSGYVLQNHEPVRLALIEQGFEIVETLTKGDWATIVAVKS
jgi:ribosomal protein L11 methyltransferase